MQVQVSSVQECNKIKFHLWLDYCSNISILECWIVLLLIYCEKIGLASRKYRRKDSESKVYSFFKFSVIKAKVHSKRITSVNQCYTTYCPTISLDFLRRLYSGVLMPLFVGLFSICHYNVLLVLNLHSNFQILLTLSRTNYTKLSSHCPRKA